MPSILPRVWMMTDERRADPAASMARLPKGAAVVFRHYDAPDRTALAERLRSLARNRGLVFLVAGDPRLASRVKADGFHAPEALAHRLIAARRMLPRGIMTMAVHGMRGLVAAHRYRPDSILVSPVFATASHPDDRSLGPVRFAALTQAAPAPVVALGGMNDPALRRLRGTGVFGYAGVSFAGVPAQNPIESSV